MIFRKENLNVFNHGFYFAKVKCAEKKYREYHSAEVAKFPIFPFSPGAMMFLYQIIIYLS